MTILHTWAAAWRIPPEALADLRARLDMEGAAHESIGAPKSEAAVSNDVRLEASQKGLRLFRNNVGAMQDETGRVVRYGLANDSKAMNEKVKSGDLIGIRPVLITPNHVGTTIGQFVSREIKAGDWRYSGTPREMAQMNWAVLIGTFGGDASFATGVGTL